MGIKALQNLVFAVAPDLKHPLEIEHGAVRIGVPYFQNMIVINVLTGRAEPSPTADDGKWVKIMAMLKEMGPDKIKEVLEAPDDWGPLTPAYIVNRSTFEVRYAECEAFGYPNVTTKGERMMENTAFRTREEAERYLLEEIPDYLRNAEEFALPFAREELEKAQTRVTNTMRQIVEAKTLLDSLKVKYVNVPAGNINIK